MRPSPILGFLAGALLAAAALGADPYPGRDDPSHLLGRPAPPLELDAWLGEAPELEGRVVLVRWWTDTCPFCATTAPALVELEREWSERGLTVVGVYHPKPKAGVAEATERARAGAERFGFGFPVGVDADWSALEAWWPGRWTSVSFLVDREGTIRWVHPGGEYHRGHGGGHWRDHTTCRRELAELERHLDELLGSAA